MPPNSSEEFERKLRTPLLAGRYIPDFFAPSVRLVVEVDGDCHLSRAGSDTRRDRALARLGYRVLRLEANLVLHTPALTVACIQAALASSSR